MSGQLPFEGYRVVDFGWVWAGAVPGQVLADMGAEVIKVESRARLDLMRRGRPIIGDKPDPEQNHMFHNINRNKLSIAVNMKTERGIELLRNLISQSDVVIENFAPGFMDRVGLSYRHISLLKPDIVMLSMSAVGQEGPMADVRSYAAIVAALSGMDVMVGYPGEPPLGMQQAYPDPNASLHAAVALLAALWHRELTGEGNYIDVSQVETGVSVLGEAMMAYQLRREIPDTGHLPPSDAAPHGHYPTEGDDRWVAIAVQTDSQFQALCGVMGRPELARDSRFSTVPERVAHRSELDRIVAAWTTHQAHYEVTGKLQEVGIPAAPLLGHDERLFDPHFQDRGIHVEIEHPVLGAEVLYGAAWKMSASQGGVLRRAPLLGEHNSYVFTEILGMSPDEIRALEEQQVLY